MTKLFTAKGIGSLSYDSNSEIPRSIGTNITDGYKAVIGKHLAVRIDANDLAFLLSSVAERCPEAIFALADEIRVCDRAYGPAPRGDARHGDMHYFQRVKRLRETVLAKLSAS